MALPILVTVSHSEICDLEVSFVDLIPKCTAGGKI